MHINDNYRKLDVLKDGFKLANSKLELANVTTDRLIALPQHKASGHNKIPAK